MSEFLEEHTQNPRYLSKKDFQLKLEDVCLFTLSFYKSKKIIIKTNYIPLLTIKTNLKSLEELPAACILGLLSRIHKEKGLKTQIQSYSSEYHEKS